MFGVCRFDILESKSFELSGFLLLGQCVGSLNTEPAGHENLWPDVILPIRIPILVEPYDFLIVEARSGVWGVVDVASRGPLAQATFVFDTSVAGSTARSGSSVCKGTLCQLSGVSRAEIFCRVQTQYLEGSSIPGPKPLNCVQGDWDLGLGGALTQGRLVR